MGARVPTGAQVTLRAPAPGEVAWIIGAPGSGKTTLGRALAAASGLPVLVVDAQRVGTFGDLPHVSARAAVEALWPSKGPRRSACVSPEFDDPNDPQRSREFERLIRAVRAGRDVALLVDEAHNFTRSGKTCAELLRLLRAARHARSSVLLTTQHLSGDVPAAALSCTSAVYVFRCQSPRALDVLEREWGLDRALIQRLPRFRYLSLRIGFDLERSP